MKFKKVGSLGLAAVLVTTTLAGCGGSETTTEGTGTTDQTDASAGEPKVLRLNNGSEPGTLNPGLAQGTHESWVLDHAFEGLFRKTVDGTIEMGVANDVTVSEDGLNVTVTLKEGLTWSNGDPVTAHDFEYQWKWILDPTNAAKYAGMLYIFEGGEAFNSGEGTADDVKIKAVDDYTLEYTLAYPMAYMQDYMTHYTFLPVNSTVAKANPDWEIDLAEYTTNGPFTVDEWNHNESIILSKNPTYYEADKINLDRVELRIVEDQITAWQSYIAGDLDMDIDIPTDVLGQLIAESNPELEIAPELSTYYFMFNTEVKPYNNVKVRQALSMAIDRETIVTQVTKGGQTPAYGMTPPGVPDLGQGGDYQENLGDLFEYDPTGAKALLEEGLAEEGMTLADVNPTIVYNTSEGHKKIAEAIQNMWRTELGIEATIENMEFQVLLDRRTQGDFQIARAGWVGDYVDPMTFLDMWETDSSFNEGHWSNAEYDALIEKAKYSQDDAERFQAYKDAETILMNEMPIIPIYFYTKAYTVKPYVTGIYKPVNRYPSFKYADIQPQ